MFTTYFLSLVLIGLSGALLDLHRRGWRSVQQDETLSDTDRRFARSQYRRRTQASGIIGVLGAAIGVGPLIPPRPWPMAIYVSSLGGACVAITLLAAIDAWASRQNFVRLQSEQLAAQIKLARELSRDVKSK
jgi:hypothetical protein